MKFIFRLVNVSRLDVLYASLWKKYRKDWFFSINTKSKLIFRRLIMLRARTMREI